MRPPSKVYPRAITADMMMDTFSSRFSITCRVEPAIAMKYKYFSRVRPL